MFDKHSLSERVLLINTLLQRGVLRGAETQNRFNLKNARNDMVHAKKLVESGIRSFAHLQIGHAWPRESGVRQFVSLLRKASCCGKPLDRPPGNLTIALSTCKNITRATAHQSGPRTKNPRRHKRKEKKDRNLSSGKFFTNRCKVAEPHFSRREPEKQAFLEHEHCHSTHFSG